MYGKMQLTMVSYNNLTFLFFCVTSRWFALPDVYLMSSCVSAQICIIHSDMHIIFQSYSTCDLMGTIFTTVRSTIYATNHHTIPMISLVGKIFVHIFFYHVSIMLSIPLEIKTTMLNSQGICMSMALFCNQRKCFQVQNISRFHLVTILVL